MPYTCLLKWTARLRICYDEIRLKYHWAQSTASRSKAPEARIRNYWLLLAITTSITEYLDLFISDLKIASPVLILLLYLFLLSQHHPPAHSAVSRHIVEYSPNPKTIYFFTSKMFFPGIILLLLLLILLLPGCLLKFHIQVVYDRHPCLIKTKKN